MNGVASKKLSIVNMKNVFTFQNTLNPQSLIRAVKKYACLWDSRIESFSKKDKRDIAWAKVCEEVFGDWHLLDQTEKYNRCTELKKKWTNVRDYFRKDLMRSQQQPPDICAQKRYIYHDQLTFLEPLYIKKSYKEEIEHSENHSNDNHNNDDNANDNGDDCHIVELFTESQQSFNTNAIDNSNDFLTHSGKRRADVPSESLNFMSQENFETNEYDFANEDIQFLLSLRSDLQRMNPYQKLDFKVGVLQLIQRISTNKEVQLEQL